MQFDCYSLSCVLLSLWIPEDKREATLDSLKFSKTLPDKNMIKPDFHLNDAKFAKILKYIKRLTIVEPLQITTNGII